MSKCSNTAIIVMFGQLQTKSLKINKIIFNDFFLFEIIFIFRKRKKTKPLQIFIIEFEENLEF